MKKYQPDEFILFLHLQKTAGMTLQELLRRHLGPGVMVRAWRRLLQRTGEGLPMREAVKLIRPSDRIFMGHFCFGLHRQIDFPVTYITFLREPVARLISLYHFSHRTPGAHYYRAAKTMSAEEFLLGSKLLETDNGMTRFIAGDKDDLFINRTPYGKCDRKLLQTAKRNLDEWFSFIGIQEEFDRSVLLLSKRLGWPNPYYVTLNVGKQKNSDNQEESRLRHKLEEVNHLDMELYHYCREKFKADFENAFPEPELTLRKFRDANAAYQRWAYPLFKVRASASRKIKKVL